MPPPPPSLLTSRVTLTTCSDKSRTKWCILRWRPEVFGNDMTRTLLHARATCNLQHRIHFYTHTLGTDGGFILPRRRHNLYNHPAKRAICARKAEAKINGVSISAGGGGRGFAENRSNVTAVCCVRRQCHMTGTHSGCPRCARVRCAALNLAARDKHKGKGM